MNFAHACTHAPYGTPRPTRAPLQLTVIENDTGRRVCSYPSQLDVSDETCHLHFEEEAWRRAVRDNRVFATDRARYSVELR